jgi:hypothetical protein
MSSATEKPEYARVTAILKELGQESLLDVFKDKKNEFTVRIKWLTLKIYCEI